jgi:hypothetical protein
MRMGERGRRRESRQEGEAARNPNRHERPIRKKRPV